MLAKSAKCLKKSENGIKYMYLNSQKTSAFYDNYLPNYHKLKFLKENCTNLPYQKTLDLDSTKLRGDMIRNYNTKSYVQLHVKN